VHTGPQAKLRTMKAIFVLAVVIVAGSYLKQNLILQNANVVYM
jgi:hypothetical protein